MLPFKIRKKILVSLLKNKDLMLDEFNYEMNPLKEIKVCEIAQKSGLKVAHVAYTNSTEQDFGGNLIFRDLEEAKKISGFLSPMYFMQKL